MFFGWRFAIGPFSQSVMMRFRGQHRKFSKVQVTLYSKALRLLWLVCNSAV